MISEKILEELSDAEATYEDDERPNDTTSTSKHPSILWLLKVTVSLADHDFVQVLGELHVLLKRDWGFWRT